MSSIQRQPCTSAENALSVDNENRSEEAEYHKQDQLKKQKEGKGHWKDELASDSESIVSIHPRAHVGTAAFRPADRGRVRCAGEGRPERYEGCEGDDQGAAAGDCQGGRAAEQAIGACGQSRWVRGVKVTTVAYGLSSSRQDCVTTRKNIIALGIRSWVMGSLSCASSGIALVTTAFAPLAVKQSTVCKTNRRIRPMPSGGGSCRRLCPLGGAVKPRLRFRRTSTRC